MGRSLGILLLLWASPAWAACLTVDTSTWSVNEPNLLIASAYRQAFLAGHDEVPTVSNGQVCFSTFDPNGVLTTTSIKAEADAALSASITAIQARQALSQAKQSEHSSSVANDVCAAADFSTVNAKIDAIHDTLNTQIQAMASLADARTVLTNLNNTYTIGLKKIARCAWASAP